MAPARKPFQGTLNILRFNWQFYLAAVIVILAGIIASVIMEGIMAGVVLTFVLILLISILISIIVSWYIYDGSGLYTLNWLGTESKPIKKILNIHAGFDETSELIQKKYKPDQMMAFDFYNKEKHTEISIRRARKLYPPYPGTISIVTNHIPVEDEEIDKIFLIFSVHEIRDKKERDIFFSELYRVLRPCGELIITEHLRDLPNFIVYTIGFFHFFPRKLWLRHFNRAGFNLKKEVQVNPFISTFLLSRNETTN